MGVLKSAYKGAGAAAQKSSNVFGKIIDAERDAIAANNADDVNKANNVVKDAQNGKFEGTGFISNVEDALGDTFNVATFGASRKLTNAFAKKENKIDYKALKAAKQTSAEKLTTDQRIAMLAGIAPAEPIVSASAEMNEDTPPINSDVGPEI